MGPPHQQFYALRHQLLYWHADCYSIPLPVANAADIPQCSCCIQQSEQHKNLQPLADGGESAATAEHSVTVSNCCRDLPSTCSFDKVVSCEMIEAVGHDNLPAYFHAIGRVLKPGGKAAIQVCHKFAKQHVPETTLESNVGDTLPISRRLDPFRSPISGFVSCLLRIICNE